MTCSDTMLWPDENTVTGVDGLQGRADQLTDECCPVILTGAECTEIACSYVDLLPDGPMWRQQKEEARRYLLELAELPTDDDGEPIFPEGWEVPCPSLALYAASLARMFCTYLEEYLIPSVRRANPHTAVSCVDDWLTRLQWQDCYTAACRPNWSCQSPYMDSMGIFCAPEFSEELDSALKFGILRALSRAQVGGLRNLCNLNWVIEPLNAALSPHEPYHPDAQCVIDQGFTVPEFGDPANCFDPELEICQTSEQLYDPVSETEQDTLFTYTCGTDEITLRPNVLAAECIVRSLLNRKCPNIIFRCEPTT